MSDGESQERPAFRMRGAELVVAALFFVLGTIVIWDSLRLGAKWAADGPQPGYFPFYLGMLICIGSVINAIAGWRRHGASNPAFVGVGQLKLVLSVLVPSAVFVALIGWLGIYVSAIAYIGFFMRWLGRYPWWKLLAVGFGTSAFFYLVFEKWFKVPLPKGPLETLLGLN